MSLHYYTAYDNKHFIYKSRRLADKITGDVEETFVWRQETAPGDATDSRWTQDRGRPTVRRNLHRGTTEPTQLIDDYTGHRIHGRLRKHYIQSPTMFLVFDSSSTPCVASSELKR